MSDFIFVDKACLQDLKYYIDNPSAWASFEQALSDDIQRLVDSARQATASGEVEPVCLVRKNDSGQVYLCNPDGTAFQPYNYIGVDFYTHPPAKVPGGE